MFLLFPWWQIHEGKNQVRLLAVVFSVLPKRMSTHSRMAMRAPVLRPAEDRKAWALHTGVLAPRWHGHTLSVSVLVLLRMGSPPSHTTTAAGTAPVLPGWSLACAPTRSHCYLSERAEVYSRWLHAWRSCATEANKTIRHSRQLPLRMENSFLNIAFCYFIFKLPNMVLDSSLLKWQQW